MQSYSCSFYRHYDHLVLFKHVSTKTSQRSMTSTSKTHYQQPLQMIYSSIIACFKKNKQSILDIYYLSSFYIHKDRLASFNRFGAFKHWLHLPSQNISMSNFEAISLVSWTQENFMFFEFVDSIVVHCYLTYTTSIERMRT